MRNRCKNKRNADDKIAEAAIINQLVFGRDLTPFEEKSLSNSFSRSIDKCLKDKSAIDKIRKIC